VKRGACSGGVPLHQMRDRGVMTRFGTARSLAEGTLTETSRLLPIGERYPRSSRPARPARRLLPLGVGLVRQWRSEPAPGGLRPMQHRPPGLDQVVISSKNNRRLWRGLLIRSVVGGLVAGVLIVLESPVRHSSIMTVLLAIFGGGLAFSAFVGGIMGVLCYVIIRCRRRGGGVPYNGGS